jgi:hypothetical protein
MDHNKASLQIWPRKAEKRKNGGFRIDRDSGYDLPKGEDATEAVSVTVRSSHGNIKLKSSCSVADPKSAIEFAALVGPQDFFSAHSTIRNRVKQRNGSDLPIQVRNVALDMEFTWDLIRDYVMADKWKQLKWRSLMIDFNSERVRKFSQTSASVSVEIAEDREKTIQVFCSANRQILQKHGISFECKAYAIEPFMHGFLINDDNLSVNFCIANEKGELTLPYLDFVKNERIPGLNDKVAKEYIAVFHDWFEQQWKRARPIWPLPSGPRA